jgi:hypothetical protein
MRSSFINIPDPFNLRVLLDMSYLWASKLTITRISLPLCSIVLTNPFTSKQTPHESHWKETKIILQYI